MQKILIIEDDDKLRKQLQIFLEKNGFVAVCLERFDFSIEDVLELRPDLILLDINLPFVDGSFICREVRKASQVPIIMLTSRNSELDELVCLNYGADQYVTKPYNIQILLAKIVGLLKRSQCSESSQNRINCGEFVLNVSKSLIERDGLQIELTKNELKILHFFVLNRGKIVSRDDVINYLWDSQSFVDDNTLTVNIKRLRDKLDELNLKDLIETKRGQGYIFK